MSSQSGVSSDDEASRTSKSAATDVSANTLDPEAKMSTADFVRLGASQGRLIYPVKTKTGEKTMAICGRAIWPGFTHGCECSTHQDENGVRCPPGLYRKFPLRRGTIVNGVNSDPIPTEVYEELCDEEHAERMAELNAVAERFNTAAPEETSEGETRAVPRVQIETAANTVHRTSARENAQGTRSNSSSPQVVRVTAAPPQLKGTIPTQGEPYRFQGHERADGSRSYSRIDDQVEEARLRKHGWNVVRLFGRWRR